MEWLSYLKRVHVRLESGPCLLQRGNRQAERSSQPVPIVMLVEAAMGRPGARGASAVDFAVGGQASLLFHEVEGRERGQPVKPLRRIRHEGQFAFLWTDDHIGAACPIFDQWNHTGTGS